MAPLNWMTANAVRIFACYLTVRGAFLLAEWAFPAFETPRWALAALLLLTLASLGLLLYRRWTTEGSEKTAVLTPC